MLNTRANRDELETVAEECRKRGVRGVAVLGDIGDPDAVEAMVKNGLAVLGGHRRARFGGYRREWQRFMQG